MLRPSIVARHPRRCSALVALTCAATLAACRLRPSDTAATRAVPGPAAVPTPPTLAERYVAFGPSAGAFAVATAGNPAPVWVGGMAHAGIRRVADDLAKDIERVTGSQPSVATSSTGLPSPLPARVILLGALGQDPLIDGLAEAGKFDASQLRGRWEASLTEVIDDPWPGVDQALLLVGSDLRGTIYAAYDLARQMGVSPWYYWDDVPVDRHEQVYVLPGAHTQGEPAVKYRGFFINDEAPALATWASRTFGPAPNPTRPGGFNHDLYARVYEILLRLRGNYLWPAVWSRSLFDDDPANQQLAADYGIVMGTSHEAPMMRAQDEWNRYGDASGPYGGNGAFSFARNQVALESYWADSIKRNKDYESLVTVGMRGNGDVGMEDAQGIELMGRIIETQRQILEHVTGRPATSTPQVWTLYKEVQRYWEQGMRAPDDITVIWCDDNWGNMRGLPKPEDPKRGGGYGLYYHFDYVGGGRNYKWVDTAHLPSTWEQLHLAYHHGVDRVWMVNVGDLKNMEQPLQFFLDYAWNPEALPVERLSDWEVAWAKEQFGGAPAGPIAALMADYHQLQSRRKPELLNRRITIDTTKDLQQDQSAVVYEDFTPFSLTNYGEAERVTREWQELLSRSQTIRKSLRPAQDDAYFELVHYAIEATANLYELRFAQFLNLLYARQGRKGASAKAEEATARFEADQRLSRYYNEELAGGKWGGFQTQAKIGYGGPYPNSSWQQPQSKNGQAPDFIWPELAHVKTPSGALLGVAASNTDEYYPSDKTLELPEVSAFDSGPAPYLEVFNRGSQPVAFEVRSPVPYVRVTPSSGVVDGVLRLKVDVDASQAPPGKTRALLEVRGPASQVAGVALPIANPDLSARKLLGFVESQGYVAIEADHYARKVARGEMDWVTLPRIGRDSSGVSPFPVTSERQLAGAGPALEYDLETFASGRGRVWAYLSPRLPVRQSDGLKYAISVDDGPIEVINTTTTQNSLPDSRGWERNTSDNVNRTATDLDFGPAGHHVLKFWMIDAGVVLQKLVVDFGGLRPSYLGPPESRHVGTPTGAVDSGAH